MKFQTLTNENFLPRQWRVAAKSSNTNSFGLRQHIAIAENGDVCEWCASALNESRVGAELTFPDACGPNWVNPAAPWAGLVNKPVELYRFRTGKAPADVLKLVWGGECYNPTNLGNLGKVS